MYVKSLSKGFYDTKIRIIFQTANDSSVKYPATSNPPDDTIAPADIVVWGLLPIFADMDTNDISVEEHPLEAFLPSGARILMLGSFPPPRRRWSMEFFYPNFQNDMWRIMGHIFFGDKERFVVAGERRFDREAVEAFCRERGIALYDAARSVVRLEGNASDDALQIVRRTDLAALLAAIPTCRAIAVTGTKAAASVAKTLACDIPRVGDCCETLFASRRVRFYRMPSSSRAYPRTVEWKAAFYNRMFEREDVKI